MLIRIGAYKDEHSREKARGSTWIVLIRIPVAESPLRERTGPIVFTVDAEAAISTRHMTLTPLTQKAT